MEPISLRDYGRKYLGIAPGTTLRGKDLDRVWSMYSEHVKSMDKARPTFEPSASEVVLPDGSKRVALVTSPNSAQYEQPYKAPQSQIHQLEDGTYVAIDPVTFKATKVWDADTGAPVKGAKNVDPFAALLGGAPQPTPVGQSGAAALEPPVAVQPAAPAPAPAAIEPQAPQPSQAPKVYSISGQEDYAKVPSGATVSWNGQTFIKR